ncbi:hypothetical protein M441DRAFT_56978 [Trichoderma asperellum CBS 433.97]|uniref:Uncharacterized protein n=1 Tax=Trichoderma asperellum (strain ATCC 204424 / CBS 433.97 / NBRC 101777) TaxID=1042311 RepID=A0A2T3ZBM1_TRIA4|nr:hypothetical protein M441DRAFT_56978 [Trichoderma asperellum CBS 433.97]PTB42196.1 hypothetical protein M441DRAFT_56978 [Trichoderma asperellum CBS 433.97]
MPPVDRRRLGLSPPITSATRSWAGKRAHGWHLAITAAVNALCHYILALAYYAGAASSIFSHIQLLSMYCTTT